MSSGSGLPPRQHAEFAVMSRLISCLVTEKLLPAFYVPTKSSYPASGIMVVTSPHKLLPSDSLNPNDIFVVVPLHHPPMLLKEGSLHTYGRRVGLVDPLDMLPVIYEPTEKSPVEDINVCDAFTRVISTLTMQIVFISSQRIGSPHLPYLQYRLLFCAKHFLGPHCPMEKMC